MRERAVWMVFAAEAVRPSQWAAICSVADKLGPTPETVRRSGRLDGLLLTGRLETSVGSKPD
jgi:hypothetical protein